MVTVGKRIRFLKSKSDTYGACMMGCRIFPQVELSPSKSNPFRVTKNFIQSHESTSELLQQFSDLRVSQSLKKTNYKLANTEHSLERDPPMVKTPQDKSIV